ncbi:beta-glucosidase family protein [Paenibacillus mucilaginosus]|uniref:BglB n=1 Tax=Paenibacillus mucilaginosus (strain KNP414) TaxID=1036673 RepID=F8FL27_PAEMK|nr:glycoside hydrolase family 3 C-terminal domain-containing protein [Paenibacillus mucilaginosus]AEI39946.1 BglB [Paenibacillus mucilaginosus KNP414]MCG7216372.1 glycoside hydrolase family 3 C-terminal domain-containing protein [Paenibacillus mucilaginosus]WDM29206.1 glycoside hydrolase family 3 C-terminal domain-containing protein [Paenibacillus mucilaginosus]
MQRDIQELISQMTLEEKAGMCSGLDFWHLKGVERLGIPSVMVTDGPHGLRKQKASADHLGLFDSVPATCFPSAAGLACSWDRELIRRVGVALGEECQAENVAVLLGPGANIKRSPLCGRNFEYFSEDPYLSSEMAASHIAGVQSQGVGTSLKHFAVNNQEHRRMSVDAVVDERTLREIYLASFEGAVKQSQPWTVMSSYNRVNGTYASENEFLLTDILKNEWGHEGFVVSDWGAVDERADALAAGLELEMPASGGVGERKVVEAVQSGRLSMEALDRAVERLLTIIFRAVDHRKPGAAYDPAEHHRLAREVARESMVLLKNERSLLPLSKGSHLAVIGAFADKPRYQGGGSSHIVPTQLDQPVEEIRKLADASAVVTYAQGYRLESDMADEALTEEAKRAASAADTAVIFAGLPDRYESEGYDRTHLSLPANQIRLIEEVAAVQPKVVVVLLNGSPVEMPWIGSAQAVLEGYLGGQAVGGAVADLLYGEANPCGKLAETFPEQLSDNPSYLFFPGEGDRVEYREGIFVGYRYYDTKNVKPLFPFGYGLSYTTFEYTSLTLDKKRIQDTESVTVRVTVKNTGAAAGKEIVQLYVKDAESTVIRPAKELKGFAKVFLQPGEERTVSFVLDKRAFAYYNVDLKDWHVETGEFHILAGSSSQHIVLQDSVVVESTAALRKTYTRNTTLGDLLQDAAAREKAQGLLQAFQEASGFAAGPEDDHADMMAAMMKYMPLRALVGFSQGALTEQTLEDLLKELNHN